MGALADHIGTVTDLEGDAESMSLTAEQGSQICHFAMTTSHLPPVKGGSGV